MLLEFFFVKNRAWLKKFNWNCRKRTGMWNFNHWKFKMLSKNWHWNHSKTVHQLIVINFSKSLLMDFLWALLGCLLKMVRKLNGRDEQGPPKRCGDLEGAWRVWKWGGSASPFEGGEMKIKSLFLREFRQGVRMAQFWQHFTIQLIFQIHEPNPLIYSV